MEKIDTLEEVLRTCWNLLYRGAVQVRHAYHTPVLATTDGKLPSARTVVLRETKVAERQLLFYTDIRTPKIEDLRQYPFASLVFWDKGKSVQIRAKGKVTIHHQDDLAKSKWELIAPKNRKDYATLTAPGTAKAKSAIPLPNYWIEGELTIEKTNEHYLNFAVLAIEIVELDFLHLNRSGHQRAQFIWEAPDWKKSWVTP
ncbi:MAG: pyridoxamine 5'-phosphate oxidase family protein [Bacteroidota bacterium]